MSRKSGLYRLTLLVLVLGFLGGGGFLAYRLLSPTDVIGEYELAADQAFEEGERQLDAKDGEKARTAFKTSDLLAKKAMEAAAQDDLKKQKTGEQSHKLVEQGAHLFWLRAQLLKEMAFADALIEGKEMKEGEDSITKEKSRLIQQIPDDGVRNDAFKYVLQAAKVLKKDFAVQYEALRLVSSEPYDWASIEEYATNVLNLDPDNVRAHWMLAQFDFRQPDENNRPIDEKNRRKERVLQARDHLEKVKAAPVFPIWRTFNLEADIDLWLARQSKQNKEETERLHRALFEGKNCALARAGRQENFKALNKEDVDAIIKLHFKAIDIAIDRARSSGDTDDIFFTLNSLAKVTEILSGNEYGKLYRADMLYSLMEPARMARPVLGNPPPSQWNVVREDLEKVAEAAVEAHVNSPKAYAALARILNQDAFSEGKKQNRKEAEALQARALKWVNDGLRLSRESKEQTGIDSKDKEGLISLHGAALEVLVARNQNMEAIKPHLEALRKIGDPVANALADIQQAAIYIREGKLLMARKSLEEVLTHNKAASLHPLALILLSHIYLTNDQPIEALVQIKSLEKKYEQIDKMNPAELAWFLEFLCEPQDIALLRVRAELETAIKKTISAIENGAAAPPSVEPHEKDAEFAISKLAVGTDANRRARTYLVNYWMMMGKPVKADEQIAALKTDYPHNVDVLRLEVARALQSKTRELQNDPEDIKARLAAADALIKEFVAKSTEKDKPAAVRFWLVWLVRTNRSALAKAYLEDPANFPNLDDASKRLLALILVDQGSQAKAMEVFSQLPKDNFLETLLILGTENAVDRERLLQEAMGRHENKGPLLLALGEMQLSQKKPEEAARTFLKAFEYTQVGEAARLGFLRAVMSMSESDPDKAIAMLDQISQEAERANEAVIYSAAAYAAIQKNDLGQPNDSWVRTKSMQAALARWQKCAKNMSPGAITVFRSKLWRAANRPDMAWDELARLPKLGQASDEVFTELIRIALDSSDDDKIREAFNYLAKLRQKAKNDSASSIALDIVEARLRDRRNEDDDGKEAIDILEKILSKRPNEARVYPILIQILNNRGKTTEAEAFTSRWLLLEPDNFLPELELIRQHIAAGKTDQAKKESDDFVTRTVDKAVKNAPADKGPEFEKAQKSRIKELRTAALIGVAETWDRCGKYAEADSYIDECLKQDEKNVEARLAAARIAMNGKQWDKAGKLYRGILAQDNCALARINLAWLQAEHLDQPSEALKTTREMFTGPLGRKEVAVESVPADILDVVGKVYEQAISKKVENDLPAEMVKRFEPASKRYPADPRMFLYLGDAHAGLKEKQQAKNAYATAVELAQKGKGPFSQEKRAEFIQKVKDKINGL